MENINRINKEKNKFWQKVMIAFCLISILLSLLSITSSFAKGLVLKNNSELDTAMVFNGSSSNESVRMALPEGGNLYLSHKLGVDLGVEKALM